MNNLEENIKNLDHNWLLWGKRKPADNEVRVSSEQNDHNNQGDGGGRNEHNNRENITDNSTGGRNEGNNRGNITDNSTGAEEFNNQDGNQSTADNWTSEELTTLIMIAKLELKSERAENTTGNKMPLNQELNS